MHANRPELLVVLTQDAKLCIETDQSPKMSDIDRLYGEGAAACWLATIMSFVNDNLSPSARMETGMIKNAARVFTSKYHYFKASEFMLFFCNVMTGKYGRLYRSLDTPTLGDYIINNFMEERGNMLSSMYEQQRKQVQEEHAVLTEAEKRQNEVIMRRIYAKLGMRWTD